MSCLIFSAREDSSASLAFARNASRPPRWSTVRSAAADTRSRKDRPNTSEINVTSFRFGRNRRFVLLLAWETLFPTIGRLPLSSHTRDMSLSHPRNRWGAGLGTSPQNSVRGAYGESRCASRQSLRPPADPSLAGPQFRACDPLPAVRPVSDPACHGRVQRLGPV